MGLKVSRHCSPPVHVWRRGGDHPTATRVHGRKIHLHNPIRRTVRVPDRMYVEASCDPAPVAGNPRCPGVTNPSLTGSVSVAPTSQQLATAKGLRVGGGERALPLMRLCMPYAIYPTLAGLPRSRSMEVGDSPNPVPSLLGGGTSCLIP